MCTTRTNSSVGQDSEARAIVVGVPNSDGGEMRGSVAGSRRDEMENARESLDFNEPVARTSWRCRCQLGSVYDSDAEATCWTRCGAEMVSLFGVLGVSRRLRSSEPPRLRNRMAMGGQVVVRRGE